MFSSAPVCKASRRRGFSTLISLWSCPWWVYFWSKIYSSFSLLESSAMGNSSVFSGIISSWDELVRETFAALSYSSESSLRAPRLLFYIFLLRLAIETFLIEGIAWPWPWEFWSCYCWRSSWLAVSDCASLSSLSLRAFELRYLCW